MKSAITLLLLLLGSGVMAQYSTISDGNYVTASNWLSDNIGGTYNGSNLLTLHTETILVNHYMTLGSFGNSVDIHAINSNDVGSITINDTTIVYGDVTFDNKSMSLVIGATGVLIILGDMEMNNKINIVSAGLLVVSGNLAMNGSASNNEYLGTGSVFATSYSGNAQTVIDDATDPDASYSTSELSSEGHPDIDQFVASGGEAPLPISLKLFTGNSTSNNSSITLSWTTSSEENFDHFEIQRAGSDGFFEVIETVEGNGYSTEEISYIWSDENPKLGINYYRLESVDFDGYRETFPAKYVLFEPEDRRIGLKSTQIIDQTLNLKHTFGEAYELSIFNLNGLLIQSVSQTDNQIKLNHLQKGIYLAKYDVNGIRRTEKFIIR